MYVQYDSTKEPAFLRQPKKFLFFSMMSDSEEASKSARTGSIPAHRNWQIETAAWIWPSFFHCALETRWLGVRKTCGKGLFYRNYRPLLQETGWLVSDFIMCA